MIESHDGRLVGRRCGELPDTVMAPRMITGGRFSQSGKEPKVPLFLLIFGDATGDAFADGFDSSGAVEDLHISIPRASLFRGDSRAAAARGSCIGEVYRARLD